MGKVYELVKYTVWANTLNQINISKGQSLRVQWAKSMKRVNLPRWQSVLRERQSMVCAPVRRDNPRAFSGGIIYLAGTRIMLYLTCTMISSVDLAHYGVGYLVLKIVCLWIVVKLSWYAQLKQRQINFDTTIDTLMNKFIVPADATLLSHWSRQNNETGRAILHNQTEQNKCSINRFRLCC